jgi:hypothetical protein
MPAAASSLTRRVLMGAEHPLAAATGVEGAGGDHLDAQLMQGVRPNWVRLALLTLPLACSEFQQWLLLAGMQY